MRTLEQRPAALGRPDRLVQALAHLIQTGENFIEGAGCQVEVDLDYCRDLAALEQALAEGRRAMGKRP